MSHIHSLGGYISKDPVADLSRTDYVQKPIFVGGQSVAVAGRTSALTISFSLTGGVASAPSNGDVVIISFSANISSNLAIGITGYTQIASLYANSSYDTKLYVGYKVITASDTSFSINSVGTGSTSNAGAIAVHVWRGLDTTSPLDTSTTATNTTSAIPTPPDITPTVSDPLILICAGNAHSQGAPTMTSPMPNLVTVGSNDTYDTSVAMASLPMPISTAALSPFGMGFTGTDSSSYSWAAVTVSLKPEATKTYDAGIWTLNSIYKSKGYRAPVENLLFNIDMSTYGGSSTWVDSVSGNNVTLVGTTSYVAGDAGYVQFDGSTTGGYCANPFYGVRDASFTISGWIGSQSNGRKVLGFESNQTGTASSYWELTLWTNSTNGKLAWGCYNTTHRYIESTYSFGSPLRHFAITYNKAAGTKRIYIDGAQTATDSYVSADSYLSQWLRFGYYKLSTWPNGTTGYWNGKISRISMYRGELTSTQINAIYQEQRLIYGV